MEEWKIYKTTYNNRYGKRVYEVSNHGRVKINGVITNPNIDYYGYLNIGKFKIHRAVAELFIPNPDNKPFVDHINTVITDNRIDNLRWVTPKENSNNPLSKEHMSTSRIGMKFSDAHRKNISESLKKTKGNH